MSSHRPRRFPTSLALLLLLLCTACGTLSVEEEKQLGRQAQREVNSHFQMMRDRVVVNYVRDLGAQLADSVTSPFQFRFYVVEDDEINAFALPGGAIYVHSGVLTKAADASEVAGVLAHEMGHVTARHVAQLYRRQRNTGVGANIAAMLIAILTGNPYIANAGSLVSGVAATAYLNTYTRDAEREADELAVDTLVRAGYDPRGMVSFFETLQRDTAQSGLQPPQFLSSHPATGERIGSVAALIAQKRVPAGLRREDGGKLPIIQERIKLIIGTDSDAT